MIIFGIILAAKYPLAGAAIVAGAIILAPATAS